jgi:hypothetical protein
MCHSGDTAKACAVVARLRLLRLRLSSVGVADDEPAPGVRPDDDVHGQADDPLEPPHRGIGLVPEDAVDRHGIVVPVQLDLHRINGFAPYHPGAPESRTRRFQSEPPARPDVAHVVEASWVGDDLVAGSRAHLARGEEGFGDGLCT